MHPAITTTITTQAPAATKTVVDSKTTTLGGNMDMSQLEDLIRVCHLYSTDVKLVAGVLTVKQH